MMPIDKSFRDKLLRKRSQVQVDCEYEIFTPRQMKMLPLSLAKTKSNPSSLSLPMLLASAVSASLTITIASAVQSHLHRFNDMYQPPSPHSANMLKLLKSSKDADVSFIVRGTTVLAHSLIITANAPILANYCNFISEADSGCSSDKLIEDVSPEVFQLILEYIYSGIYPSNKNAIKYDKELINAANKNELVELKMVVENMLVQECVITKENVSDYIVFADSKCCPLLKEYALSYFVLHYKDVLKKEDSKILCESRELLSEIINLVGQSGEESLSVAELRKELGKLDLDVDGSKQALVSRLEGAKRQAAA